MRLVDRMLQRWRMAQARPWVLAGAKVLDIGCYQGEFLQSLRRGIGPSVGMDPRARRSGDPSCQIVAEPFRPPSPFGAASFDVIVMQATLEHILDKPALARECSRLLAAGGRLIITVPSPHVDVIMILLRRLRLADAVALEEHHGYNPRTTPALFQPFGFRVEHAQRFQCGLNNLFGFRKE